MGNNKYGHRICLASGIFTVWLVLFTLMLIYTPEWIEARSGYRIFDKSGKLMSNNYYEFIGEFNENGVACAGEKTLAGRKLKLIDYSGNEVWPKASEKLRESESDFYKPIFIDNEILVFDGIYNMYTLYLQTGEIYGMECENWGSNTYKYLDKSGEIVTLNIAAPEFYGTLDLNNGYYGVYSERRHQAYDFCREHSYEIFSVAAVICLVIIFRNIFLMIYTDCTAKDGNKSSEN